MVIKQKQHRFGKTAYINDTEYRKEKKNLMLHVFFFTFIVGFLID